MSSPPWNYIAKLVCIGDSGCGKSSLTIRLCEGRFSPQHDVTIGVEFGSRIVPVGPPHSKTTSNPFSSSPQSKDLSSTTPSSPADAKRTTADEEQKHMKLSLWDTAGQEIYKSVTRSYFRGASGALLVFDITRRATFVHATDWLNDLRAIAEPDIVVILVGNKLDCVQSEAKSGSNTSGNSDKREVTFAEAQEWAQKNGVLQYVETSAKSGENVEAPSCALLSAFSRTSTLANTTSTIDGWMSWPHYPKALELGWDNETLAAVDAILKRPWFSRLWVIQEALLSNRHSIFQCGSDKILWNDFRGAVDILRFKTVPLSTLQNSLAILGDTIQDISVYQPAKLLRLASARECSDLRDKVYGVLSITPPGFKARVQVNYALPVADVYRNAFSSMLDHSCRLDALLHTSRWLGKTLPSWLPDWSRKPDNDTSPLGGGASNGSEINPAAVATSHNEDESGVDTRPFCFCLTRGANKNTFPESWFPTSEQWKTEFIDAIFGDEVTEAKARLPERLEVSVTLSRTVLTKSVAAMENGFIGLVNPSAQEGDMVVNVLGCAMPLILRQAPNSVDPDFEIVGEAFVPGTMHGELLLGPMPSIFSINYVMDKSYVTPWFVNSITGERQKDDPRLGSDPEGWERLLLERTRDDPYNPVQFRNKKNGRGGELGSQIDSRDAGSKRSGTGELQAWSTYGRYEWQNGGPAEWRAVRGGRAEPPHRHAESADPCEPSLQYRQSVTLYASETL
ncbi:hypothetical protein O1611_g2602 [Lasiodiplodia mahajangana]|uniref:Uncharacterized protein n=1 Tax=Lasiodiplodia mahajangana TaxID=1108764 RepID=A0ACC2JUT7_9PEZI|nr:hypothetical protein O1611_g2602 [Lasiodiplodia mahajangana]